MMHQPLANYASQASQGPLCRKLQEGEQRRSSSAIGHRLSHHPAAFRFRGKIELAAGHHKHAYVGLRTRVQSALIFCSIAMAAAADAGVGLGIGLLLLSLVCLGTWPAVLRLCTYAPGVRVGVEGDNGYGCFSRLRRVAGRCAQSRHPCHAYLDYAIAYAAFSSTVPILLSHLIPNEEESEDGADISGVQKVPLVLSAIVGGSLLSLGNMSTQWATTMYASPLTTVLALQASLTVVLGTSIN